ncbi:type II toxin-antitoxin system PemK/MazF family toxin [Pseudomonas putida]
MQTIIVRYQELILDGEGNPAHVILGSESYEDIKEALIPSMPRQKEGKDTHPVFLTKRFINRDHHVWRLENILVEQAAEGNTAIFDIIVRRHDTSSEEFLYQTLKKNRATPIKRLIRQGTLVEVDFGFVQQIARSTAALHTNKRYVDTLLFGEMHKRRLAVVVKVISKDIVQVAPVTSASIAEEDRTSFKISQDTLDKMPRYKDNGKESNVLCSMLETVSTQRILPPLGFHRAGAGRNPGYNIVLKGQEIKALKIALVHAVGASDYVPGQVVLDLKRSIEKLEGMIAGQAEQLAASEASIRELDVYRRLAAGWAEQMGLNLEEEVEFQKALDQENGN